MTKDNYRVFKEYFDIWDMEVSNLDSEEIKRDNLQMFDFIINFNIKLISDMKDRVINNNKDDTNKMYNELTKLEKNETYKNIKLTHDYALKLQSDYKRIETLKNRRTKENILLRNENNKR